MGDAYYFGSFGLEKDRIQAYVWYSLAANDNARAARLLDHMLTELSPQQLLEAKRRLDIWGPGQCARDLEEAVSNKDK